MDHDVVCDCPFVDVCDTYCDQLISWTREERHRRGCLEQNDIYRNRHCTSFRCMYLSRVVSSVLKGNPTATGK